MFRQLRQFQGVRARISRQRVQEMEGGAGSVPEIFGAIRLGEDLGGSKELDGENRHEEQTRELHYAICAV